MLGQALLAQKARQNSLLRRRGRASMGWRPLPPPPCWAWGVVFMGKEDTDRQALNVYRMELLQGPRCTRPVTEGSQVLKDAVNAAMLR